VNEKVQNSNFEFKIQICLNMKSLVFLTDHDNGSALTLSSRHTSYCSGAAAARSESNDIAMLDGRVDWSYRLGMKLSEQARAEISSNPERSKLKIVDQMSL
jgi:hypothetical protein